MRILFCGSRDWDDPVPIQRAFDRHHPLVVIHGAARGADSLAAREGVLRGLEVIPFPADWKRYGRGAGPIRNQQMLDEGNPDLVIAFHEDISKSKGTADMVRRAKKAGVPVEVIV